MHASPFAGNGRYRRGWPVALVTGVLVLASAPPTADAARPVRKPPAPSAGFIDHFNSYDSSRWSRADGWTNGSPFDNAWSADHVVLEGGRLDLRLDDQAMLGEPYTSGELRTNGFYGYGCYEASFKPIAAPGVVTSLFTFAGPYDNGGNGRHNEIDIEFLGNYLAGPPWYVQLNFWTNDDSYASRNEALISLTFDPAAAYHRYGFKWTAAGIEWFVDGQSVYSAIDRPDNPTPKVGESLQKIMVNAWPVDETAVLWAGEFKYPNAPLHASYERVRHIEGEDCSLLEAPVHVPPPSGSAAQMSVQDVALSLAARDTQVVARVSVVDGLGRPVAGATVDGAWSGIITGGDTRRTTDALGVATFYSSRSRDRGSVTFCVADAALEGMSFAPQANVETCDSIAK